MSRLKQFVKDGQNTKGSVVTAIYEDIDDEGSELHVSLTSEGVIADVVSKDDIESTMSWMADEFAELTK